MADSTRRDRETPRSLGYRMPAEWERHRGTWLSWPHKQASWPGLFERIPPVFAEFAALLSHHEEVHINVIDRAMEERSRRLIEQAGGELDSVFYHPHATNDAWCRDHGPIFVQRSVHGRTEEAIIDWGYNAWGGKYPPFQLDDTIPDRIGSELGLRVFHPGIVMEGGSLDVNGYGSLLTTKSCLLNPNRNPSLTDAEIEDYLREYLGVSRILWLGDGIEGDDTDGHVDDISRFVNPTTIVTVVEPDPDDPNHAPLEANLATLHALRDQDGEPFTIVTLPMPGRLEIDGQRLPASYANFYIANEVVAVPTYDPATDEEALATLRSLFPDRTVTGIDCRELVWGLGALHCISQQWPAT